MRCLAAATRRKARADTREWRLDSLSLTHTLCVLLASNLLSCLTARSWSRDGVTWSDPRIGGYNGTIAFPNGTSMNCRRERPQILLDPESGEPIGISNGVQVLTTLDWTWLL
eukprot:COSAG02_NODE_23321_length_722_cov_1.242376_2_plen_112_part_00